MKNVIEKYVSDLTVGDIYDFIRKNNIEIDIKDIETIYRYIKKYWKEVLEGNTNIFNELKKEVAPSTYLEVMKLYDKYKKWI